LSRAAARPPIPAETAKATAFRPGSLDLGSLTRLSPPSWATSSALRSLNIELKKLQQTQAQTTPRELGWYIDFDRVENMFQWIVELHSFDLSFPLAQDMQREGVQSIVCEMRFGANFPISPPFVRVIRPRFLAFQQGGGGHVTAGGAMCMELLTNTGWSPVVSIESVLLQVRLALCSQDPRPARLVKQKPYIDLTGPSFRSCGGSAHDYGIGEAIEAYIRAASTHGWRIPDDLRQTANGI
jgi:ubiquitin-conjugating enzyme E2 Q